MTRFEQEIAETQKWFESPRFAGTARLYTARQVVEQRGTIAHDYTVAREAAAAFYERLRQLFGEKKSITTFGPYSPGQAVVNKRMGIERIYLGGCANAHRDSPSENPTRDWPATRSARCPTGRGAGARPAHRRSQPAVSAGAHDREAAQCDAGRRLSSVHHRRCRYRPWG